MANAPRPRLQDAHLEDTNEIGNGRGCEHRRVGSKMDDCVKMIRHHNMRVDLDAAIRCVQREQRRFHEPPRIAQHHA